RLQPGQQLPISTHPAMNPLDVGQIMSGIVFEKDDIRHQTDPAMKPLEEIVAEQRIFRGSYLQAALECRNIINALADVDTLIKQVLIDIRYRQGIQVQTALTGKYAREGCPVRR